MGIPEKCWRGCWHRCWQKWGCWPECWHRCWQVGPFGKPETKQPASACASTLTRTPIFASTCASTPASTFLEFPPWGPVPGRRDLNLCLEKQAFLSPLRSVSLRPYRIFSPYRNSLSVVVLVRDGPLGTVLIGGVPTTPDPNTSARVSRYKLEAYRDANWWCVYYFLPRGGHTFAKVSR